MAESRRTPPHLLRTPKLQLIAKQPLTGECWIPPKKKKKKTQVQGQRRSPNKTVGGVKSRLESNATPLSKVMLKVLQARLQQYVNRELPDVQAGFRKDRGTRDQIANICWITGKAIELQKKHLFLLY